MSLDPIRRVSHISEKQRVSNRLENAQAELQSLVIRDSHNIEVVQTEAQALLLVQLSLVASIQAIILLFGDDPRIEQLQKVAQSLENLQLQSQSIYIEKADGIIVAQTELQLEAVVQATITLLAQIAAKVG
ncbi:spore coat protein [Gottfriedia luciferensis]|uniref:spore coat protein n=1 Tax=Gottfriedia luciferensis TaxID=178774 RepID=UPI000B4312C5|nr:spore coat protein [Gottfriedia luciferensis]